jgi:hypothetical protein
MSLDLTIVNGTGDGGTADDSSTFQGDSSLTVGQILVGVMNLCAFIDNLSLLCEVWADNSQAKITIS